MFSVPPLQPEPERIHAYFGTLPELRLRIAPQGNSSEQAYDCLLLLAAERIAPMHCIN